MSLIYIAINLGKIIISILSSWYYALYLLQIYITDIFLESAPPVMAVRCLKHLITDPENSQLC